MNRKFTYYALIWAILFAVFNVICFVTPSEAAGMNKFGGAFWAGYSGITIAFIGQLICAYIALKTEDITKLFYNIPIITVSYTGLVLTIIFGGLCMAIPNIPNWVGIIVCLAVFAITAIATIMAKASAEVVERIDVKVKAKTLFIKSLSADAESLIAKADTPGSKEACKKVYEAVRYSDPMSSEALAGIEGQITLKFNEFTDAVSCEAGDIGKLAEEVVVLVEDRNKKCKLVK